MPPKYPHDESIVNPYGSCGRKFLCVKTMTNRRALATSQLALVMKEVMREMHDDDAWRVR